MDRRASVLNLALLVALLLSSLASAESRAFYVDYSSELDPEVLLAFDEVIIHPDAIRFADEAIKGGTDVFGYLSVGEVAADARYRERVKKAGVELIGTNEIWGSDIVDVTDERWQAFVINELAAEIVEKGVSGLFLDTVDSVALMAARRPDRASEYKAGMIQLILRLQAAFPNVKIIMNRGLDLYAELMPIVHGILVESVWGTFDFETNVYRSVPPKDTAFLLKALKKIQDSGTEVYVLDYVNPSDRKTAEVISRRADELGFKCFLSTPELDGACLGPQRRVARKILGLFGHDPAVYGKRLWAADSYLHRRIQAIIESLGYEMVFQDVYEQRSPRPLGDDIQAVITDLTLSFPKDEERRWIEWLIEEARTGRRPLIFTGRLPVNDPSLREQLFKALGIHGSGAAIVSNRPASILQRQPAWLGKEVALTPQVLGHLDLQAPTDSKIGLRMEVTDLEGSRSVYDPLFVTSWGGYWGEPYLYFQRPDYQPLWVVNATAFLNAALRHRPFPRPDSTTRYGLRTFYSHVDSMGFGQPFNGRPETPAAEILYERVFSKYRLPFTVSLVEAEVRSLMADMPSAASETLEAVAKRIFQLPNVQAGSGGFSDVQVWVGDDPTRVSGEGRFRQLKKPQEFSLEREILGSLQYFDQAILPEGKSVELMQWTGNYRPGEEALIKTRDAGLMNLNGGGASISRQWLSLCGLAPKGLSWGSEFQVYASNKTEIEYNENWSGPLFGRFRNVLDTYDLTETPERLAPVNVHFHFLSGTRSDSLVALVEVLDWVSLQPLHYATAVEYVRSVVDSRDSEVFECLGDSRWVLVNQGQCQTWRFEETQLGIPDMNKSHNLLGFNRVSGEFFLSAGDGRRTTVSVAQEARNGGYLQSSTRPLNTFRWLDGGLQFKVDSVLPSKVVLAGKDLEESTKVTIEGDGRWQAEAGEMRLALEPGAKVTVQWADGL